MPVTVPGLNDELVGRFVRGDLSALEKIFRAAHPSIIARARESVDDDAAASRVAQTVILELFADRSKLRTPAAVVGFLDGITHEVATREAIRVAGLRTDIEGHERPPAHALSPDEIWAHVQAAMRGPDPSVPPVDIAAEREKLRHEAAEHIKALNKPVAWMPRILIGAVILVALGVAGYFVRKGEREGRLELALSKPAAREINTGTAQLGTAVVDEKITAALGAESRLTIPKGFNREVRGIALRGTARFSVTSDEMPFQVVAANVVVTASDAVFGVSAYPDDSAVTLTVSGGSLAVKVKSPVESEHALSPGQSLVINAAGAASTPTEADLAEKFGYVEGTFTVQNRTVKETLAAMKRWYGTDIQVKDSTIADRTVTLTSSMDSQASVIRALQQATKLEIAWDKDRKMVLQEPRRRR